jgi:predicted O-methyltransferase YrrM
VTETWEPRAVPPAYRDNLVDPSRPWQIFPNQKRTLRLRRWQARQYAGAVLRRAAERLSGVRYVGINYRVSADLAPRYGFGKPPHARLMEIVAGARDHYAKSLETIDRYAGELLAIENLPSAPREPAWDQTWLPALDGSALYSFVRDRAPSSYVEVGSGWSTKFVARAVRDGGLDTRITSIDPEPRTEVDALCTQVIRSGLETADLRVFSELSAGDMVFIDNSHRCFTNSDVTAFFLDVLPALPDGVLVGIHDITLPVDYPPGWMGYYFSEQYLLASYLLAGCSWIHPELACLYAASDLDLGRRPAALVDALVTRGCRWVGTGFWFTVDRRSRA